MIDLYYWTTPNGHKITMFLEETGLAYRIVRVDIGYAIERYVKETNRLYGVLNRRLADRPFIAGDYSIADIAAYPWIVPHEAQRQKLEDFTHLRRWFQVIHDRPATLRAYEKAATVNTRTTMTEEPKRILFGQTARP